MTALPRPAPSYSTADQQELRNAIERMDRENFKKGSDLQLSRERIILSSENGSRFALKVDDAGELFTEAVT